MQMFRDLDVPKVIDYLSLDVEGAEYFAFKDFDFSEFTFLSATVERPKQLHDLLLKNDYFFLKHHGDFGDTMYIHKTIPNFDEIMKKHGGTLNRKVIMKKFSETR